MENAMVVDMEEEEEGITLYPSDFVKIEKIEEGGQEIPEKYVI